MNRTNNFNSIMPLPLVPQVEGGINQAERKPKRSKLVAKWEIENGKLVCRWLIEE
jgi:hypothetical protein